MDDSQAWVEVMVSCDAELAETISEIFSRYVTHGVVTETEVKYDDAEEIPLDFGPVKVIGYIAFDDQIETKKEQIEQALWHLNLIQPIPKPVYRKIEDQNWMESWKKFYQPIQIGEKLMILPAWFDNPSEERIAIKIDPSLAFGTGMHPTTQLCLALAEPFVKADSTAIDVGCGSGILAIAAALLGAKKVLAVDLDTPSIEAAHLNAAANQVETKIELSQGSLDEILTNTFSFNQAPLVMVNILAPIILRLFKSGLAELVSDQGFLVLSGILDRQADEVQTEAEARGFKMLEKRLINDWVGFAFQKTA